MEMEKIWDYLMKKKEDLREILRSEREPMSLSQLCPILGLTIREIKLLLEFLKKEGESFTIVKSIRGTMIFPSNWLVSPLKFIKKTENFEIYKAGEYYVIKPISGSTYSEKIIEKVMR